MARTGPSLLVFADDWGRHPSSCQHLVRRLLPSYEVTWVNTIGMRRPAFDRVTLKRGLEKVRGWLRPAGRPREISSNPRVLNPVMWPWFQTRLDAKLNQWLLRKQLEPAIRSAGSPVIGITTLPIIVGLVDRLLVARWVYYCVDDFSKWPGLHRAAIDAMERKLVQRAEVIVAASEKLQERIRELGRPSHLLTHGVDLALWRARSNHGAAPQLEGLERPLLLFWGSIDWQIDIGFIARLAGDLRRGTLVFVGPRADHDPALFTLPRVRWVPAVPYEALPSLAREAAVLIMPYLDAPGLRESQPLKLKEYLATDKPAVVRDLPANRVWADALDLAGTAEEFSAVARERLDSGLPASQAEARKKLQTGESWEEKAIAFEAMAFSGLSR